MNSIYTSPSSTYVDPFILNGILLVIILAWLIYLVRNLLEGKDLTKQKVTKIKYTKKVETYHHWDHTPLPIMKKKIVPTQRRYSRLKHK